ncbi:hypothetical protein LAG90_15835 [Marinilongibacter aquaticus]|uniref:hypothetical protein n=1 Tax=Marinilongibacter aquaticus TaxID=2975157 RepID=UPI0021BDCABA|nr:hypothetical protein [Marinilongibacter aquaticus]UBM58275.1 hypothetical protein LAG90_15835 [Marinilongibacter aquaticus]
MRNTQIGKKIKDYTIEDARAKFQAIYSSLKGKKSLAIKLSEFDDFYSTYTGYCELDNVKRNRASLGPTLRAIAALEALISKKTEVNKIIKRQKLIQK